MLADLNALLDAARPRRGHRPSSSTSSWTSTATSSRSNPQNLDELVDALARRAAAAERLMASLSPRAARRAGRADGQARWTTWTWPREMAQLQRRPARAAARTCDWRGRERMRGDEPLGLGDATSALEELADLEELRADARPGLPRRDARRRRRGGGASARSAGAAVDDLRRAAPARARAGAAGLPHPRATAGSSSPRRRCAGSGRPRCAGSSPTATPRGRGDHDVHDAGAAGELTGASRPWQFGDEQPLDVVRTVTQRACAAAGPPGPGEPVRLAVEDFEVVETERRTSAAVALLRRPVVLDGAAGHAGAPTKQTALALHTW